MATARQCTCLVCVPRPGSKFDTTRPTPRATRCDRHLLTPRSIYGDPCKDCS